MSLIHHAFKDGKTQWDISLIKHNNGPGKIARSLVGKTDLVAVYGGDGCVTSVAAALYGTEMPMAIIPGGTANVMAKELGIPLETAAALELLSNGKHRIRATDMGLVNGKPFLLRVNLGIMAEMVTGTDRSLKDKIGQLAYGITALKTVTGAEPIRYQLNIDGQKVDASGVALTITNSGNVGIGDFNLLPGISITDGLLNVILMKDNNWLSVLKIAGSTLLQNDSAVLMHWTGKKMTVKMGQKQSFICDDRALAAKRLKIEVVPGSIRLLVPA